MAPIKSFSEVSVTQEEGEKTVGSVEEEWARIGADQEFSEQKHAYVLTFPWNYPQIIENFQSQRTISESSYWGRYVKYSSTYEFNVLFREYHQACAMLDPEGINKVCEGKLADAVNQSLERIHFHGLDIEMANLTVQQPSIRVLSVEINHGLSIERKNNGALEDYDITKSSIIGTPCTYYVPKNAKRDIVDGYDAEPYSIAVTALIESPMKLFVQNQNYSKILFGSDDAEMCTNVVRFEANMKWADLFRGVLPVYNKPLLKWKITDFNNLMNENPHF